MINKTRGLDCARKKTTAQTGHLHASRCFSNMLVVLNTTKH